MITPTVGRVVWYVEHNDQTQPMAAMITFVHSDTEVNLSVMNHAGGQGSRQNVRLIQSDEETLPVAPFCMWMPYQTGQAQKTQELEAKLQAANDASLNATTSNLESTKVGNGGNVASA